MLTRCGQVLSWKTLASVMMVKGALRERYHIVQSLGVVKRYHLMKDITAVFAVPPEMCLAEVIVDNTARPILDIDYDVGPIIPSIDAAIVNYFQVAYGVTVSTAWIYSSASTSTWHCIVVGVYFSGCWKEECIAMGQRLNTALGVSVDINVYRTNSSLRMPSQYKLTGSTYCKMLVPMTLYPATHLFTAPTCYDIAISSPATPALTPSSCATAFSVPDVQELLASFTVPEGLVPETTCKVMDSCVMVRLRRVAPSHCVICRRVHHCDNAYLVIRDGKVQLRCFRQPVEASHRQ